jgi:hypothetical protein
VPSLFVWVADGGGGEGGGVGVRWKEADGGQHTNVPPQVLWTIKVTGPS